MKHNVRVKVYPDGEIGEIVVSTRRIFTPEGWEPVERGGKRRKSEQMFEKALGDSLPCSMTIGSDGSESSDSASGPSESGQSCEQNGNLSDSARRSMSRARKMVFDLIRSNAFTHFATYTINPEDSGIDRYDYKSCVRKFGQYLSNEVKRRGMKYVAVPELHKDGAVHFHAVCAWEKAPRMVRARSAHTGEELSTKSGQPIYNLPNWAHGFTTCIPLYGDSSSVGKYVAKYITKAGGASIGGRHYLSGGALGRPRFAYMDIEDLWDLPNPKYSYNVPTTDIVFYYYDAQDIEKINELTIFGNATEE